MQLLSLLQEAPAGGGGFQPMIMIGLMFIVFYFFMIRPQMRKQKKEKKFQENLKKGDFVVTTSGIHGKLSEIDAQICVIETGAGKIKFERASISAQLTQARQASLSQK